MRPKLSFSPKKPTNNHRARFWQSSLMFIQASKRVICLQYTVSNLLYTARPAMIFGRLTALIEFHPSLAPSSGQKFKITVKINLLHLTSPFTSSSLTFHRKSPALLSFQQTYTHTKTPFSNRWGGNWISVWRCQLQFACVFFDRNFSLLKIHLLLLYKLQHHFRSREATNFLRCYPEKRRALDVLFGLV